MEALVASIVSAAGELIIHVVKLCASGDEDKAAETVDRFRALTREELDSDREAAETVLRERFR